MLKHEEETLAEGKGEKHKKGEGAYRSSDRQRATQISGCCKRYRQKRLRKGALRKYNYVVQGSDYEKRTSCQMCKKSDETMGQIVG